VAAIYGDRILHLWWALFKNRTFFQAFLGHKIQCQPPNIRVPSVLLPHLICHWPTSNYVQFCFKENTKEIINHELYIELCNTILYNSMVKIVSHTPLYASASLSLFYILFCNIFNEYDWSCINLWFHVVFLHVNIILNTCMLLVGSCFQSSKLTCFKSHYTMNMYKLGMVTLCFKTKKPKHESALDCWFGLNEHDTKIPHRVSAMVVLNPKDFLTLWFN
jgi:hypothetical protein